MKEFILNIIKTLDYHRKVNLSMFDIFGVNYFLFFNKRYEYTTPLGFINYNVNYLKI
jgi:hypothetical protein